MITWSTILSQTHSLTNWSSMRQEDPTGDRADITLMIVCWVTGAPSGRDHEVTNTWVIRTMTCIEGSKGNILKIYFTFNKSFSTYPQFCITCWPTNCLTTTGLLSIQKASPSLKLKKIMEKTKLIYFDSIVIMRSSTFHFFFVNWFTKSYLRGGGINPPRKISHIFGIFYKRSVNSLNFSDLVLVIF